MKRVLTALVLIPVVLAMILRAPVPLLAAVVAVIALLGCRELLAMAEHYGIQPLRGPTYVYVALIFIFLGVVLAAPTQILDLGGALLTLLGAVAAAAFLFLALAMRRTQLPSVFPAAATSVMALLYVALPLALLVVVRELWAGGFLLLYLLLVVWAGDTFAYYTGRAIGRHKMAPRVSPGKTWEGGAASFVGGIAVGWAVLAHAPQISSWLHSAGLVARQHAYLAKDPPGLMEIVILSACINVAAQTGDLVESVIKRGAAVKDSGALLPGHGGILDRVDALLFAAPVLWYYAALRVMTQGHL